MKKLHLLDALRIVGEALKILSRFAKLLGAIAFTLLPPLSFAALGHRVISEPLLSKITMNNELLGIDLFSPATENIRHILYLQFAELLLLTAVYKTLTCSFSLLSTSAVVYTAASIYTGKKLTYTQVMKIVPRVWKRVMHTFLWIFLIVFLYYVGAVAALLLWVLISGVVGLAAFLIGFVAIAIVHVSFHLYLAMVWQVASVVCGGGEIRIGCRGEEQTTYQRKSGHGLSTDSFVPAAYRNSWWRSEVFSVWRAAANGESGSNGGGGGGAVWC